MGLCASDLVTHSLFCFLVLSATRLSLRSQNTSSPPSYILNLQWEWKGRSTTYTAFVLHPTEVDVVNMQLPYIVILLFRKITCVTGSGHWIFPVTWYERRDDATQSSL